VATPVSQPTDGDTDAHRLSYRLCPQPDFERVSTGTASFSTTATQSSNVALYAITGTGITPNSDYTITQASANSTAFDITPAQLLYVATPVSQTYGTAIPTLTGSVTGFVLGQTVGTATTAPPASAQRRRSRATSLSMRLLAPV